MALSADLQRQLIAYAADLYMGSPKSAPHLNSGVSKTMKTNIIMLAALTTFSFLSPMALAKRIPAPKVEPVIFDGIQYIAPNDNGRREYIHALDAKTGELLKEITVKRNFIRFWIEEDLQWFYITKMEVQEGYLVVTDEKNRMFKVKLIKKKKER